MSYETNPILNRLKISKGWKTSSFTANSLNYSRDMKLWFKVYLFLKFYLLLYGIRLLKCEMRVSAKHTKMLYLSIIKQSSPRRKRKSRRKFKLGLKTKLQRLRSPLARIPSENARYLLYCRLWPLKKKAFLFLNTHKKKMLSPAWIAKPRSLSWINSLRLIYRQRMQWKWQQQLLWKKKLQSQKRSLIWKNDLETKKNFWQKKQRQLFSLLTKMQKSIFLLETALSFWHKKKIVLPQLGFWQSQLQEIEKVYDFLEHQNLEARQKYSPLKVKKRKKIKGKRIKDKQIKIIKSKTIQAQIITGKQMKIIKGKKIKFKTIQFKAIRFKITKDKKKKMQKIIIQNIKIQKMKTFAQKIRRQFYQKKNWGQQKWFGLRLQQSLRYLQWSAFFWPLSCKRIRLWKKTNLVLDQTGKNMYLTNVSSQMFPRLQPFFAKKKRAHLKSLSSLIRTNFFRQPRRIVWPHLFLWKRFARKTKRHKLDKFGHHLIDAYREHTHYHYKKLLNFSTNLRFKYCLQDVIKKYLGLTLRVKISWPLSQFKNLKFYRLLFPMRKNKGLKKKIKLFRFHEAKIVSRKKYSFWQPHHLRFSLPLRSKMRNQAKRRRLAPIIAPIIEDKLHYKTENLKIMRRKKKKAKKTKRTISTFWNRVPIKETKRNKYLMQKKKDWNMKTENRLVWSARNYFAPDLTTTLTWFAKYLDPQPVVDHVARIIGTTKKHMVIFRQIELILKTLSMKRGLGYRMALIGRINGANKSRTLFLRKLNRSRSRQSFAQQVNFALAHAKASIGAFSIKLWIYS